MTMCVGSLANRRALRRTRYTPWVIALVVCAINLFAQVGGNVPLGTASNDGVAEYLPGRKSRGKRNARGSCAPLLVMSR